MSLMNNPIVDVAVKDAASAEDLANKLAAIDPKLADPLRGKALVASKTPWGVLAATAIAYVVSKYGLGWDTEFVNIVAGLAILGGSYAMRQITNTPITSLLTKKQ